MKLDILLSKFKLVSSACIGENLFEVKKKVLPIEIEVKRYPFRVGFLILFMQTN